MFKLHVTDRKNSEDGKAYITAYLTSDDANIIVNSSITIIQDKATCIYQEGQNYDL